MIETLKTYPHIGNDEWDNWLDIMDEYLPMFGYDEDSTADYIIEHKLATPPTTPYPAV